MGITYNNYMPLFDAPGISLQNVKSDGSWVETKASITTFSAALHFWIELAFLNRWSKKK